MLVRVLLSPLKLILWIVIYLIADIGWMSCPCLIFKFLIRFCPLYYIENKLLAYCLPFIQVNITKSSLACLHLQVRLDCV